MATDAGQQATDLSDRLLARGDRYSFFQATRLLRLLSVNRGGSATRSIRARPALGLGFPNSDILKIEARDEGSYRIVANFLGLYGVTSPLPTHYTEELLSQLADGFTVNQEFLDIFAQSVYPNFFRAWLKPRASLRIVEYNDSAMLDMLYAFVGVPALTRHLEQGMDSLLQCGALFSQQIRSGAGLQAMLEASFPQVQVQVKQLQAIWVKIPDEQIFKLGERACSLGQDSHLGGFCRSFNGVTICLTDIDNDLFEPLLPGGQAYERLKFLVDYYLIGPLSVRVELSLKSEAAQSAQLSGERWSRLGRDTWLLSADYSKPVFTFFDLPIRQHEKRH